MLVAFKIVFQVPGSDVVSSIVHGGYPDGSGRIYSALDIARAKGKCIGANIRVSEEPPELADEIEQELIRRLTPRSERDR